MAIQGIINGFGNPENKNQNVILIGRGNGYTIVVDGLQRGEQESTLDAGLAAFAKACEDKPATWREVRETTTSGETGVLTVTELGARLLGDYELSF